MPTKKAEPELDMSIFYKASGCPLSKVKLDNPEHQALLERAIATPTISHSAIVDVLWDKWGVKVGKETVAGHRATPQKCSCRSLPK